MGWVDSKVPVLTFISIFLMDNYLCPYPYLFCGLLLPVVGIFCRYLLSMGQISIPTCMLHPFIQQVRYNFKLLLHARYLNDGTGIRDSQEMATAIDIIRETCTSLGIELNIRKNEIFLPLFDGSKLCEDLFPS